MKNRAATSSGILLFVIILSGILYVNLLTEAPEKEVFTNIVVTGNKLQSVDGYLISSDLNKSVEYPDLSLQDIKIRISSHPYVKTAEIQSNGNGTVEIKIIEKDFMAVLLTGTKPFLVTDSFELINMKMNSDISGLPVVSNCSISEIAIEEKNVKCDELVRAFKIIDALKIVDEDIEKNLAEINLRNGRDVVLSFSDTNYPVIIGKGAEGKKIVLLCSMWKNLNDKQKFLSRSSYVDLRFNNEIIIGKPVKADNNG